MKMKLLHGEELWGGHGHLKIEINVNEDCFPNDDNNKIDEAAYKAVSLVKSAIMENIIRQNPEAMKRAAEEKKRLLELFPKTVSHMELPNGYCSDYCCKHLPWFKVFTEKGPITIGRRKHVISIDWNDTSVTTTAQELFPYAVTTKEGRLIHAWSYADAKRYIDTILGV